MLISFVDLFNSSIIAICAVIYSTILAEDRMILGWLRQRLEKFPEWIYFPLIGCFKCVSGQLALWMYVLLHYWNYDIFSHVSFICVTIFISLIINKITEWATN